MTRLSHFPTEHAPARRGLLRAERTLGLAESVIREMTRLAFEHGAINLSQGYPDFPAPAAIKDAAKRAIDADINQYSITWGAKNFREALARKVARQFGWEVNPEREVTVVCGATEGMFASCMALLNPGDEVVIFEPFYENYGPDCALTGAVPRHVALRPPDWSFSAAELEAAFNDRTRAIVLNTPNNPTGKVFSGQELETIAGLCKKYDVVAITDEIYEHILYDGHQHISIATLEGMRERTVTISSLSKTYSVTGWRVGWVIAPPELTDSIRKVHDFLTVNSPAPLQEAAAAAVSFGEEYYRQLAADYTHRRDRMLGILGTCGFHCFRPAGAYYIMTDVSAFGYPNDTEFVKHLIKNVGVAAVPGSSFYKNPENGAQQVRFTFCKKEATFDEAERRLQKLRAGR
ncbi:MAG: aminotransferase class I/II-fold pyridoxal phosphate-dependent enzyme [Acidobacteria bacterium]|nr:aminotransferase class I/II-fold pyridoxal phosphate-dependent enzyme [Acidobacteriota bacterium]